MLDVRTARTLTLEAGSSPGRAAHLSAGSGVVRRGERLYVIGDDELHLAVFDASRPEAPGRLQRLFPDRALSEDARARKAHKPDLEALCALPPFEQHPHGALLALGSGSTTWRDRGVLHPLAADGALSGQPVVIDLKPLYASLRPRVRELNVEGVTADGDRLLLFQRGNGAVGDNAVISLSWGDVVRSLLGDRTFDDEAVLDVRTYSLGGVGAVMYTFTDADALPDGRIVFTAAAEDTDDPYADGVVVGSAVGVLDPEGEVMLLEPIADASLKAEGVDAILAADGTVELLIVCDADDPAIPSPLLEATLTP